MIETSLDRFSLEKVKLVSDGGLDVHFELIDVEGNLTFTDKNHKTSNKEPHPDLVTKIKALKPILAELWGYHAVKILTGAEKFKGSHEQQEAGKREYLEQLKKIEVTGIILYGKGTDLQVKITGKRQIYKKIYLPMLSSKIKLSDTIFGFEGDLEEIVEEIRKEVYEYLFNGKQAQLSLFGDKEQKGAKNETPEQKETPKKAEKVK